MIDDPYKLKSYILENSDIGIRVLNLDGKIIYVNKALVDLLGDKNPYLNMSDVEFSKSTIYNCMNMKTSIKNRVKLIPGIHGQLEYFLVSNIPIIEEGNVLGAVEYIRSKDSYGDLIYHLKLDNLKEDSKSSKGYTFDDFLTIDSKTKNIIDKLKKIAITDYSISIYGETGTGKEIIAQSIHNYSLRKNKPFVAQNCAAIPDGLLESIFFGAEEGSYTGSKNMKGLLEQVDGGTLFLDELNSLPEFMQAKLLRVLEEKKIRKIGGTEVIDVDFRLITSSNVNYIQLIKDKKFRVDLYYRIGPVYVTIPPLRNRKDDIHYLLDKFLHSESKKLNIKKPSINKEVVDYLNSYSWPGNVRELKNFVKFLLVSSDNLQSISIYDLPDYIFIDGLNNLLSNKIDEEVSYNQIVERFEKDLILKTLEKTDGNISKAAEILNINRTTLQYKIKTFNIND